MHGRGDGSFLFSKYTALRVFVAADLLASVRVLATAAVSLGITEGSKGAAGRRQKEKPHAHAHAPRLACAPRVVRNCVCHEMFEENGFRFCIRMTMWLHSTFPPSCMLPRMRMHTHMHTHATCMCPLACVLQICGTTLAVASLHLPASSLAARRQAWTQLEVGR